MDILTLFSLQGTLFAMMLIGAWLKKRGIIDEDGKRCLTDLCINIIIPFIDRAKVIITYVRGRYVYSNHIDSPRRGQEHTVDLNRFAPGVYVLHVNTLAGSIARKVVVR